MKKLGFLLLVAACGDDKTTKQIDAAVSIDTPTSTVCTNAIYDPCTDNSQCTSGNCRLFTQDSLQVCTETCTPGAACPMAGNVAVTCNNMGFCKPPAATACTR